MSAIKKNIKLKVYKVTILKIRSLT